MPVETVVETALKPKLKQRGNPVEMGVNRVELNPPYPLAISALVGSAPSAGEQPVHSRQFALLPALSMRGRS